MNTIEICILLVYIFFQRRRRPQKTRQVDQEGRQEDEELVIPIRTVKAFNFESHGNIGPFIQTGLLFSKRVLPKMNGIKVAKQTFNLRSRFGSFLAQNSQEEAKGLKRQVQG